MPVDSIQMSEITGLGKKNILPSSVLVEVCHTCNEHCIHCCLERHVKSGLTLEQYNTLFDQMVEAGTFFVILTGGEPFTRPDFLEIVTAARKRRLSVTIFTNGTLLTAQHIDALRSLFVDEVHVSIYSADAEIHDKVTGLPGSWAKSIAAIKATVAVGITVRIKCPLMKLTVAGVDAIKQLGQTLGVDVQFTTIITAKNDGNLSTHRLRLSCDQLEHVLSDPDVVAQGTQPIVFRENLDCVPCDTVFNGGAVDPDGNLYPCNQLQLIGGNITCQPLDKIWKESPIFNWLRKIRLRELKQCNQCNLFQRCTRCPGLALLEDGDVLACSSAAKMVAQAREKIGTYPTAKHIFSQLSE